ncbi:acetolactate synthase large subunit [Actinomadura bangladeshensis]|uniref:Acetolactate synthase large subunit n=1 Tax=Actinomadura bangladeshensis TaxID=453573 RepID=A0A4R4PEY5_9ACTN|nr:acetolactate synthase large subunit [Actinomadura bangladeshensis]TDC20062.1 acetolactate synthase large subunit [Actinomadura bangladeshensis]
MNGAQAMVRTLAEAGVGVWFANPGTSELHLVAALDGEPRARGVLCLFEGVATGAADGYGRMAPDPAAVLLHLGPGLGNGLANLHNARRAGTPVVTVIGDHATSHERFDAPLQSDIAAVAGSVSAWMRRPVDVAEAGKAAAEAVAAARAAGVATLVVPADVAWSEGGDVAVEPPALAREPVAEGALEPAAAALASGEPCVVLIGGDATRRGGLEAAGRIAAATGARVLCETFPARLERGAGLPAVERLAYLGEMAAAQLDGARHIILAGARRPVTFFAYPGKPGDLVPDGCQVHDLGADALGPLADAVGGDAVPALQVAARPDVPTGALTGESAAAVIGALLPEGAIVSDEANTSGLWLPGATAGAPPHDWLSLTGGAIGQGLPVATGAAIACPDRPVVCMEADGSAMYTLSALWTQAREGLDVTTVVFNNGSYAILSMETTRVGAVPAPPEEGTITRDMVDLSRPALDFVALASGMGVPASRAHTAEELADQFGKALAEPGPHLIEAVVPPLG